MNRVILANSFKRNVGAIFIVFLVLVAAVSVNVLADIAPDDQEGASGGNISTVEQETNVKMKSENVVIRLTPARRKKKDSEDKSERSRAYLKTDVEATFTMLNTGDEDESMDVSYPIAKNAESQGDEIKNVKVTVDGKEVQTEKVERMPQTSMIEKSSDASLWVIFPVVFKKKAETEIEITYYASSTESSKTPGFTEIEYRLETGALWLGTIGRGNILIEMPFEYNDQYIKLDGGGPWQTIGNNLVWRFTELEPESDDNVSVLLSTDVIKVSLEKPYFEKIEASSYKEQDPPPYMENGQFVNPPSESIVEYYPYYAIDGNKDTAWAVYRPVDPDPWLMIRFKQSKIISGFSIINGFNSDDDEIPSISGAKRVDLEFSNGEKRSIDLKDSSSMQNIEFPEIRTSYIKLLIIDDYSGDERVAISELNPKLVEDSARSRSVAVLLLNEWILIGLVIGGIAIVLCLIIILIYLIGKRQT